MQTHHRELACGPDVGDASLVVELQNIDLDPLAHTAQWGECGCCECRTIWVQVVLDVPLLTLHIGASVVCVQDDEWGCGGALCWAFVCMDLLG